jgi:Icc-related predicted phosphoesterase
LAADLVGASSAPSVSLQSKPSLQNQSMKLENAPREATSKRMVVVLHYAPIAETAEGEPPALYPFLGCSRLAETIDRFPVAAVVHGHAHRGKYQGRTPGGAVVYNVALSVAKPGGEPYALIALGS